MSTQTDFGHPRSDVPPLTLGWRLQMALRQAGVSVQEMADELGMARNSLSRWLNDHAVPRTIFVKAWALRTGVPYEWLWTGQVSDNAPDSGAGLPRQDLNLKPSGYATSQVTDLAAERLRRRPTRSDDLEETAA